MNAQRRLQWSAAVVIATGFLSFTTMAPRVAQANPCAPIERCPSVCWRQLSQCQAIAPPGCTATSITCIPQGGICGIHLGTVCHFD
jgi:hypothetical protein